MGAAQSSQTSLKVDAEASQSTSDGERRGSGRRARARDRLMDRATRPYPQTKAIQGARNVENLMLFIDDDLRETALALSRIETYLVQTLDMLEQDRLGRKQVVSLASDQEVLEQVDQLNETLESMRGRMRRLASCLK